VRQLAREVGWRNTAKMIAYGPVLARGDEAVVGYTAARNGNGHKRNAFKKALFLSWWENGKLKEARYDPPRKWEDAVALRLHVAERARELDATRFQRDIPWLFAWARPRAATVLDKTDVRLAHYYPAECCGSPMGIMESWTEGAKAIYQCAVNPKHRRDAVPRNTCSRCGATCTDKEDATLADTVWRAKTRLCGACHWKHRREGWGDITGHAPSLIHALARAEETARRRAA
jgi:hypothetical protein